ncbi:MAG: SLBB domain-containing protein [Anaerolineae bacterium]|nr:SLBB domain-containing protein [Anaerolineae bacterium]
MERPTDTSPLPVLERYKYVVFVILAGALLAGVIALIRQRPDPTTITVNPPAPTLMPSITPTPTITPTPGPYMVYITGAVATPEAIVTLDYGSRVLHALDAAGGALNNADLERVNLAQVLEDGDQVHVPTRDGAIAAAPPVIQHVTSTPGTLTVYVVGEVVQQNMLNVPAGSRVEDAITAAGGATDNADLAQVNLSQRLNDGDYIYVPPLVGDTFPTPTPNHPPLIHVNSATLEELDSLPGIGPALAQAIIDYRTANGPFRSLEDLDNVSGIGPSKLEAIRDLVTFD